MKAEEFFTRIALSYQDLLSTSGADIPCLRDYCRSHHVSYPDFKRWASVNEIASGILGADRSQKRLEKEKEVDGALHSSNPCGKSEVAGQTLLFPLHIISEDSDNRVHSVDRSSILQNICITFPNGVEISVGEANSRGIYSLVHGKGW